MIISDPVVGQLIILRQRGIEICILGGLANISICILKLKIIIITLLSSTLHPEKLASKKFGYLACDR